MLDMTLAKAHSVNFYVSAFTFIGLIMLLVIGLNMYHEVNAVDATFTEAHKKNGNRELARGVEVVFAKAHETAEKLAQWDETNQQLTNPVYYRFWRQQRIQSAHFVPDYVNYIELYSKDGKALLTPRNHILPDTLPKHDAIIVYIENRPWLLMFKPVMLYKNSSEVFGYVGIGVNFIPALLELNLFTHLDASSITFNSGSEPIVSQSDVVKRISYEEMHTSELDQLKQITYTNFSYIVGLVLIILIFLYWMVVLLFAKPLVKLNRYIQSAEQFPFKNVQLSNLASFPLIEFNNFLLSLKQYQLSLYDTQNNLKRLNRDLEQRVQERTHELQSKNKELESFSYSVSHDLRAPLRSINGFIQILVEEYGDKIDESGKSYLERVKINTQHMSELIDDLLKLAQISRQEITKSEVNLSEIALEKLEQLKEAYPTLKVTTIVDNHLSEIGDQHLVTVLLHNLIDNAWKYSSKNQNPEIRVGKIEINGENVIYVKDNGVGFDMKFKEKLFKEFSRLHGSEFEGTGIGLATVGRIVSRHGGRIWAEAEPNKGACFYFTLSSTLS